MNHREEESIASFSKISNFFILFGLMMMFHGGEVLRRGSASTARSGMLSWITSTTSENKHSDEHRSDKQDNFDFLRVSHSAVVLVRIIFLRFLSLHVFVVRLSVTPQRSPSTCQFILSGANRTIGVSNAILDRIG